MVLIRYLMFIISNAIGMIRLVRWAMHSPRPARRRRLPGFRLAVACLLPGLCVAEPLTHPDFATAAGAATSMAVILPDVSVYVIDNKDRVDRHAALSHDASVVMGKVLQDEFGSRPPLPTRFVPASAGDPEPSPDTEVGANLLQTRLLFSDIADCLRWRRKEGKACVVPAIPGIDDCLGTETAGLAPWLDADLLVLVEADTPVFSKERARRFFNQQGTVRGTSHLDLALVAVGSGRILWYEHVEWNQSLQDHADQEMALRGHRGGAGPRAQETVNTPSGVRSLARVVLVAGLAGCALPPWRPVGGRYDAAAFGCSVDLPAGWCQDTRYGIKVETERLTDDATVLWVTRDGLQRIAIYRFVVGLSSNASAKLMREGMSAEQVLEIEVKGLEQLGPNLGILDRRLVNISGRPGYRLTYTVKGDRMATEKRVRPA